MQSLRLHHKTKESIETARYLRFGVQFGTVFLSSGNCLGSGSRRKPNGMNVDGWNLLAESHDSILVVNENHPLGGQSKSVTLSATARPLL